MTRHATTTTTRRRRRRRVTGPFYDERTGRWTVVRYNGAAATYYTHRDRETCRRLAGLRARKERTA